jgi:hypothetical protein
MSRVGRHGIAGQGDRGHPRLLGRQLAVEGLDVARTGLVVLDGGRRGPLRLGGATQPVEGAALGDRGRGGLAQGLEMTASPGPDRSASPARPSRRRTRRPPCGRPTGSRDRPWRHRRPASCAAAGRRGNSCGARSTGCSGPRSMRGRGGQGAQQGEGFGLAVLRAQDAHPLQHHGGIHRLRRVQAGHDGVGAVGGAQGHDGVGHGLTLRRDARHHGARRRTMRPQQQHVQPRLVVGLGQLAAPAIENAGLGGVIE